MPIKINNKLYTAAQELIRAAQMMLNLVDSDGLRTRGHLREAENLETAINAMRDVMGEIPVLFTGETYDAALPDTYYPVSIAQNQADLDIKMGKFLVTLAMVDGKPDAVVFSDHTTQVQIAQMQYEYTPPPSADPSNLMRWERDDVIHEDPPDPRNDPTSDKFWLLNP